jgi:hypothetical protein
VKRLRHCNAISLSPWKFAGSPPVRSREQKEAALQKYLTACAVRKEKTGKEEIILWSFSNCCAAERESGRMKVSA